MITAFPKIFPLGQDYISKIFDGPVEVTEKIDGSQFVFGNIDGDLQMRSKGTMIHDYATRNERDLFYPIIQHALRLHVAGALPNGFVFFGETLKSPKHNTLCYERIPKNHFALFAVAEYGSHKFLDSHEDLTTWSNVLDTDVVPLLYQGEVPSYEFIKELMDDDSVLGGAKMEGVVVKNYNQPFLLGGQPIPVMAGKYVSEEFKEVHRSGWSKENTGGGRWQTFKDGYRTEARWRKAVEHLRDSGQLENSPRDIGKLIPEIQRDITDEEKEIIKNFLWREFGSDVLRTAIRGFPEWYKDQLLENAFEHTKDKYSNALEELSDA
jgi:hypothetical protein